MSIVKQDKRSELIRTELNKVSQRYLRVMLMISVVYYSTRGITFLMLFEPPLAGALALPPLVSGIIGLVLYYWVKSRTLERFWIEVLFFTVCLFLTINLYWNYYRDPNPFLLTNAALVVIAVGLGTTYWVSWLIQVVFVSASYLLVFMIVDTGVVAKNLIVLFSGFLLSLLAFLARAPVVRERVLLDVELAEKAEKLQEANSAKDRFVANMTHELRTPLTGVMGMMDLMRDTNLDREQAFMLENAHKSAGYLLNIIHDILDFAKLEAGMVKLKPQPVDVVQLTIDTINMFEAEAKNKKLDLLFENNLPVGLHFMADGIRVGQILINIIGNAVKFTDAGSVKVSLRGEKKAGGYLLKYEIADTGPGIEDASKLFFRFEQADSSITRTKPGTGLGLAICRDLLDLMGGSIEVQSKLGEGAVFSIEIPLDVTDPDTQKTAQSHRIGQNDGPANDLLDNSSTTSVSDTPQDKPVAKWRALLAEDNEINQTILTRMLKAEGFEVVLVDDGQKAVDAAQQLKGQFDIIFMDIQMPELDGVSATRIIRLRDPKAPPIVAVTANTMEEDIAEYRKAGIVEVLGKPVNRDELRRVIREQLGEVVQENSFPQA